MPRKQPLSTLGGRALVTAALVVLTATGATAQTADTGVLTGRVTDAATGAPIADAILTASQPDGAYSAHGRHHGRG